MRSDAFGIRSDGLIILFLNFEFWNNFFRILEIFCMHFCSFFTRGEGGQGGHSYVFDCSSKKKPKLVIFQIFVLEDDADKRFNLSSSITLLFLFHKGWKCVLTHLGYVARAWFIYFSNLILVTICLEYRKYVVIFFLHFLRLKSNGWTYSFE